jgi:precorrin-6A/cobalt-precorrin-6A reductase
MTRRVLVLGGTAEGRSLASRLAADPGTDVVSSLAGRVRDPLLPPGRVRIGGFSGPDGLAAWLRAEHVDAILDATHPFAATISRHAAQAAAAVGVPLAVVRRPGWQAQPGDKWYWLDSVPSANDLLPELGKRVFLATGRGDLGAFAHRDDLWFLLRTVDPPAPPLPAHRTALLARGPFDEPGEQALLREHRIDVLVTRDSGGGRTSAKLAAARALGLPVLLARRPPPPDVPVVTTVSEAVAWLEQHR